MRQNAPEQPNKEKEKPVDQQRLQEILTLARQVGWEAGAILRRYYRGEMALEAQEKEGGPVTAADGAANHHILDRLQTALGTETFGYLSEETYQGGQFPQEWVWVIDPLDGTRDFIDKTGEYAIHIALLQGQRPALAVVVLPEVETLYFALRGSGTFRETKDGSVTAIRPSDRSQLQDLSLVVSRTHRDQRFQKLIDQLPLRGKNYVGSVGCKIATILEQQSDVYISLSGKSAAKDWDFAAPELILTEAGGQCSHFDGRPLTYNTGDVHQWGAILASNGPAHTALCAEGQRQLAIIDQANTAT